MQSNNELPFDQRPTIKLIRKPVELPSRCKTLIGITLDKDVVDSIRRVSQENIESTFSIKYECSLMTENGIEFEAQIVSHLPLEDYIAMKGFRLIKLHTNPVLAKDGERTRIG